jgi:hypothetical protein
MDNEILKDKEDRLIPIMDEIIGIFNREAITMQDMSIILKTLVDGYNEKYKEYERLDEGQTPNDSE